MAVAAILACAAPAFADEWNDKTILTFDTPVMVPGATLPAGTYIFKLLDSKADRGIVQILNQDGTKAIATLSTVPTKRSDPSGDVVLKFNPTDANAPVALKAWFYPGSIYGHQFVYPDAQAREIAQRTKTVVLSTDVPGTDKESGTLYTYDAAGHRQAWQNDAGTLAEWQQWTRGHAKATARVAQPGTPETRESTAPLMQSRSNAMTVALGDLEEHPNRYIGKTITVTGAVDDVFGPRMFKIDEPHWGDLDREVLVYLPADLAALVKNGDRVTVTGTMKMLPKADVDRELAWLRPEADVSTRLTTRPALVASTIVGGDSNVALAIHVNRGSEAAPVGTSGTMDTGSPRPITDVAAIAKGDRSLVGRRVQLTDVTVDKVSNGQGFWLRSQGASVFVLPPHDKPIGAAPSQGQSVSVEGVVLQMPSQMQAKADAAAHVNDDIYISATAVR